MITVMVDLRQTEGWAKYLKTQGWKAEDLNSAKIYIRKIPLFGSVIKIQRPEEIPPIKKIDELAEKYHAIMVKLEPLSNQDCDRTVKGGFRPDPAPNLPTKTLIVDLTKSEEDLWRNLSQDARQSIKKARKNKLVFSAHKFGTRHFYEALEELHLVLAETGRRQKFWTPSLTQLQEKVNAFGKNGHLFIVRSQSGKPLAGALVLGCEGVHSASSKEGRHLFASYLLIWEVMLYLKKQGIKYHDLSGIYDPRFKRITRRWHGFTAFKRKFGGREFDYPNPLVKIYNPFFRFISKILKI
jgi:lipid II:glycine glycyltransferase (peptidoglycan interpeptide bridge formation enzyme)